MPLSAVLQPPQLDVFVSGSMVPQLDSRSVGGMCVETFPLPLNPFALRLMSFGFVLRASRPEAALQQK
jgi:hypothetical protein